MDVALQVCMDMAWHREQAEKDIYSRGRKRGAARRAWRRRWSCGGEAGAAGSRNMASCTLDPPEHRDRTANHRPSTKSEHIVVAYSS